MLQVYSLRSIGWLAAVSSWCVCAERGGGNSPTATRQTDTRALAVYYREFSTEHGGRPPKDEAESREFLATKRERLDAGGLDADRVLTSPKSGAPWVVGYGTPIQIDGRRFVAYENSAVDGKRTALNERGGFESIEDAKIQALVSRDR